MSQEWVNVGLAFVEGLGLILSPCIWPILPFILTGSLTGSRRRPFSIIIGFIVTFALFTFFSRQLVQLTGIDLGWVRHISYVLLLLFGVVMMSTYLTEKFATITQRLNHVGARVDVVNNAEGGVISGLLFGSLVALIWTPCAGPILAAVIVQAVLQISTLSSFFVVLAFGMGAALPMLFIALFGRAVMDKVSWLRSQTILFRKMLGAIMVIAVGYMIYGEIYQGGIARLFLLMVPLISFIGLGAWVSLIL